ncbi:hypothetical protein MSG28_001690 [Choristoneura fumiferana]|uniref:Uncharacterized protein n=1 Tax=Choristoneura fumiferana TaxID=7141 RepID=A0ACC0KW93_CHOFU|nr:hypothetical protein MSG28_001690 [Choristoneura fumiferana]
MALDKSTPLGRSRYWSGFAVARCSECCVIPVIIVFENLTCSVHDVSIVPGLPYFIQPLVHESNSDRATSSARTRKLTNELPVRAHDVARTNHGYPFAPVMKPRQSNVHEFSPKHSNLYHYHEFTVIALDSDGEPRVGGAQEWGATVTVKSSSNLVSSYPGESSKQIRSRSPDATAQESWCGSFRAQNKISDFYQSWGWLSFNASFDAWARAGQRDCQSEIMRNIANKLVERPIGMEPVIIIIINQKTSTTAGQKFPSKNGRGQLPSHAPSWYAHHQNINNIRESLPMPGPLNIDDTPFDGVVKFGLPSLKTVQYLFLKQPIYVPLGTGLLSEQEGLGHSSHAGQCGLGTSHAPLNRFTVCPTSCARCARDDLLLLVRASRRAPVLDESDGEVMDCTPPNLREKVNLAMENMLPHKSKELYMKIYDAFMYWRKETKTSSFSENVALVLGINGACGCLELTNISINDVEHHNNMILVKLRDTKTKIDRMFVVRDEHVTI